MEALRTEYDFELPMGYVDAEGTLQREGKMRLATAADEIVPMKDPRVQQNPPYLTVILLSRVVTRLGNMPRINTQVIEGLYSKDFAYLQNLYNQINHGAITIKTACPKCDHKFEVEMQPVGE